MIKQILGAEFNKNNNHQSIKQIIRDKIHNIQKVALSGYTQQTNQYLHQYAKRYMNEESYKKIEQMTNDRYNLIVDLLQGGDMTIPQTISQKEKIKLIKPIEVPAKKMSVTIDVSKYKDEDIPISQNHQYWSYKHNKAKEIKQYVKKLHEAEQKFKKQMKQKRNELEKKQILEHQKQVFQGAVLEQKRKNEMRNKIINKIKQIEENAKYRNQRQIAAKNLYESFKVQKPLYQVIQQKYKQKYQIPLLEQRKLKLQNIRKIRNPSISQIKEHSDRYEKYRQNHLENSRLIYNSPLKVSFKSDFHKDLSEQNKSETDIVKQLYEKKIKYAKEVKSNFKPIISEKLAEQIKQRLNENKKRKKRRKIKKNGQDQQQQEEQEQEEEVYEVEESEDQNSQNGHKNKHTILDPYLKKRNSLGRKYLQYMKGLKKKSKEQIEKEEKEKLNQEKQQIEKNKFHKINYLQQFKTNRSVNISERSHFQNWEKDFNNLQLNQNQKKKRIYMKAQIIDQKAHMKDIQLTHKKLGELQKLQERKKVDSHYIDAIKAKLAIMQV